MQKRIAVEARVLCVLILGSIYEISPEHAHNSLNAFVIKCTYLMIPFYD